MDSNSIYKSPEILLDELGISTPEDIDVEAIAQYCDATILYESLTGCAARLLGFGNAAIITVDLDSGLARQRFSAAHELGHWMYDRGSIAYVCTEKMFHEEWFKNNKEARANKFAADILLPIKIFKDYSGRRDITFYSVKDLAKIFKTSLTATAIRLVEHGSYPAMLICSDLTGRRWFNRGPDVPRNIWPHEMLHKDSVAYDICRGKIKEAEPADVYASAWINHPNANKYEVREHSIKITKELVLSLIWWKDENQLVDILNAEDEDDDTVARELDGYPKFKR